MVVHDVLCSAANAATTVLEMMVADARQGR